MKVITAIEKEDGTAEFSAVLSQTELTFLLDFAINVLLSQGVTFLDKRPENVHEMPEQSQ